jgi:hypothetical protein
LVFILAICNLFPHVTCTISFTNSHPLSLKSPWVLSFLFFVVSCPCFLVVPLHEGLLKPPCCLVSSKILSKPRGSSSNWTGPSQPVYGLHTHTHKKKKNPYLEQIHMSLFWLSLHLCTGSCPIVTSHLSRLVLNSRQPEPNRY